MALALSNIKSLLDSLRLHNWYITAFPFNSFCGHDYVVIFEDLRAIERGTRYFAVELTFIDIHDEARKLKVRANAYGINDIDRALLFFEINTTGRTNFNPAWLIYNSLNAACPKEFINHPNSLRDYIIDAANSQDTEHGHGNCCYKAVHNGLSVNGKQKHRSEINTTKTRLLRPDLYNLIGANDDTISFYYRENNELSDAEIILSLHREDIR